jgi:hypothetical protein
MESLGFDTIIALHDRRLLLTRSENALKEHSPQAVADIVMRCEQGVISPPRHETFSKLFGVDLAQSNANECPRTAIDGFREQILWGE